MSEQYDVVLAGLRRRLLEKHLKYGLGYLEPHCTFNWLFFRRFMGEVIELGERLFSGLPDSEFEDGHHSTTEEECYDVAICALLIADKRRMERIQQREEGATHE
jgi:hypothetical protein